MRLDDTDVLQIEQALKAKLDKNLVEDDPATRGWMIDMLQNAANLGTIFLSLRLLVTQANAILDDIERNTRDKTETLKAFETAMRKIYLDPAKKNIETIQKMINEIVLRVKKKLDLEK